MQLFKFILHRLSAKGSQQLWSKVLVSIKGLNFFNTLIQVLRWKRFNKGNEGTQILNSELSQFEEILLITDVKLIELSFKWWCSLELLELGCKYLTDKLLYFYTLVQNELVGCHALR